MVGEPARHAVVIADDAKRARGDVTERGELEALVKLSEVREVHHLRDQPAADHANADPRHGSSSRARRLTGHAEAI
jgi:hypothetical protein